LEQLTGKTSLNYPQHNETNLANCTTEHQSPLIVTDITAYWPLTLKMNPIETANSGACAEKIAGMGAN